jgi:hypothetical protein
MKLVLLALAALLVGPVLATGQTSKNLDITVTHGAPVTSNQNFFMIRLSGSSHFQWLSNVVGGAGSAKSLVGTLGVVQTPVNNSFTGQWSIGGPDAALFSVDPASGNLSVGSSDLAVKPSNWCTSRQGEPCYVITATATQSGIYNSPYTDEIEIYVVDPASSPPSLSVSKTMAMPGDVVTVTVANDPNPNGTDCVALAVTNGRCHALDAMANQIVNCVDRHPLGCRTSRRP